jgi:AhpD family alkylhydroperoxidase
MTRTFSLAITLCAALVAVPAYADKATTPPSPARAALTEIEGTLGFVPAFIRVIPDSLLPGVWDQLKSLEMNPKTALDNRTKELIGLAVASQIPCEFCIYFHTKAAKANGATDQQIQEAVGMASLTRAGSTMVHGLQVDLDQYKKDVDRIFRPHH